jgi:hypothetical protein
MALFIMTAASMASRTPAVVEQVFHPVRVCQHDLQHDRHTETNKSYTSREVFPKVRTRLHKCILLRSV